MMFSITLCCFNGNFTGEKITVDQSELGVLKSERNSLDVVVCDNV